MKNTYNQSCNNIFAEYALSIEEMICVHGGSAEDDGSPKVIIPPVVI
jgi:hypothetical protein